MSDLAPRRTLGDVLYELLGWNTPLEKSKQLKKPWRFGYALAGSVPWIFINFDPEWLNILAVVFGEYGAVISTVLRLGLGLWFAWLISYRDRPSPPTRFFLEGLLLPGVAASLLSSTSLVEALVERLGG